MTWAQFYAKWCSQYDDVARRTHMALSEAGYVCELIKVRRSCGHRHVDVDGGWVHPPSHGTIDRAARISMPPEMYEDWVTAWTAWPWALASVGP